ncbi:MAG: hypothetical protein KA314_30105, partial [Chloroflexi bacterium]|nr:hypothetical protein [Chloroflexota bacterium]
MTTTNLRKERMVCGTFSVFSTYTQSFDVENRLTQVTQSNNSTATRFSYDASGQRTRTEIETGNEKTITYYPFPNYEEEVRQTWVCLQYSGRFCISYGW